MDQNSPPRYLMGKSSFNHLLHANLKNNTNLKRYFLSQFILLWFSYRLQRSIVSCSFPVGSHNTKERSILTAIQSKTQSYNRRLHARTHQEKETDRRSLHKKAKELVTKEIRLEPRLQTVAKQDGDLELT